MKKLILIFAAVFLFMGCHHYKGSVGGSYSDGYSSGYHHQSERTHVKVGYRRGLVHEKLGRPVAYSGHWYSYNGYGTHYHVRYNHYGKAVKIHRYSPYHHSYCY